VAFFDDFTSALKQKWLQYYQLNDSWLALQMEVENVKTPDGGRRPSSYLILGVLNALEPKLAQLMLPFSKLNSNPDSLIDVLDLNFDPDIALGKRPPLKAGTVTPPAQKAPATPAPALKEETEETSDFDGFTEEEIEPSTAPSTASSTTPSKASGGLPTGAAALGAAAVGGAVLGAAALAAVSAIQKDTDLDDEMDQVELDDEPLELVEESETEDVDDIGLSDFGSDESLAELTEDESDSDSFADISLDAFGDTSLDEDSSDSLEEEFSGLSDVWGGDTTEVLSEDEDSMADFGDLSLDEFGSDSDKKSDDDDAFGDLGFDPFAEPTENELDEWK